MELIPPRFEPPEHKATRSPDRAGRVDRGLASPQLSARFLAAGNRAVAHALQRRPAAILQRVLRGTPDVRSGANGVQLTEQQARQILRRLAAGDATAFALLDPVPGAAPDPLTAFIANVGQPVNADPYAQGREYGIIVENGTNEAHIVGGTSGSVQWAGLLNQGRAVAHLHPLVEALEQRRGRNKYVPPLPAEWNRRWITPNHGAGHAFADIIQTPGAYVQFLPTIGDITFCAEQQIADHTVHTPYAFHNNRLVDPHTLNAQVRQQTPLVHFRILNAVQAPNGNYVATMEAYADAQLLWSRTATVRADMAATMPRQTIYALT